jgi:DNA-binding LytR/AlgR family response regulator
MPLSNEINCIIIEDELPASVVLEIHISKIPFLHLKGKFSTAVKALPVINAGKINLIFLDINLPGIPGVHFAKSLHSSVAVIFTTAYTEYAVESFELDAIDYLLKPISFERFTKAINRYLKYHNHSITQIGTPGKMMEKPFVFVKSERRMVKIFLDEILYLEAQRNYLLIYMENEVHRAYQSISQMEEKLPEGSFVRIHRSFLISISRVKAYTSSHVVIQQQEIPIGRLYSSAVEGILKSIIK